MTQLDLICKVPTRGTQAYEILTMLQGGQTLTVGKALRELGVYALSQRVGELRRAGWPILSRTIETNGGARVSEYFMDRPAYSARADHLSLPRSSGEAPSADAGNHAAQEVA